MKKTKPTLMLLAALEEHGGFIESSDGRATNKIREESLYEGDATAATQLLARMERDKLITRSITGKRCYRIEINRVGIPASWKLDIAALIRSKVPQPAETPDPVVVPPSEPTIQVVSSGEDFELGQVVEGLSFLAKELLKIAARPPKLDDTVALRLASTLEDNQTLRGREQQYLTEIAALRDEKRHLAMEASTLRDNLSRVMADSGGAINHEVRKRLEQVMREKPRSR